LVAIIIGVLIFSLTGFNNFDKKNKFVQKENLDTKNKVQDKVNQDEANEHSEGICFTRSIKINESLPEYSFEICGDNDGDFFKVNKIEIYDGTNKGRLIQKLDIKDSIVPINIENAGVEFVDANFDGYLDLQIQTGMGAGSNIFYSYWLWNMDTSMYVLNEELSLLTSTKFDSINKTITSENSSQAGAYYIESVYKYIDEKLTLIKETERIADTEKKMFNYTVRELVNNELKITKQYSEPF
jgi:hypothetical protein